MKAYNLRGVSDLRLENVANPKADNRSVVVKVRAAGICGSDIPRIYVNGTYHFPTIPGHEFAGEVVDGDTNYLGKKIGVFPLIPCMDCDMCKQRRYEMCKNYNYLGSRCDGGFAEYVKVPKWNLIELEDGISFADAAMMEPMAVAVHAIRTTFLRKDDFLNKKVFNIEEKKIESRGNDLKIAVCGLGTIGFCIVMFLLQMGFKNVYAIGNKDFQRKKALELGIRAENYVDIHDMSDENGNIKDECNEKFDVFFEAVGKNEIINMALCATAPGGRIKFVGNPASDISMPRNVYWKILRKQLTITGTWNSSFLHDENDDWNYVHKCLSEKTINPSVLVTHTFDFENLMEGFELMHEKKENFVKVMGIFD